jgi:hypothetical protein
MKSVQLVCRLPHFEYWNKLEIYLKKKKIDYRKTLKNTLKIVHRGVTYNVCKNSIVFYFPTGWNILASDPEVADSKALARGRECLDKLRSCLGIDFRIKGDYLLNITRSKTSWVNNEIAKTAHKIGDKIYCKYKGKLWLIADRSFNVNELEFLDHKEKNRDIEVVVEPFMNKLREDPHILDSLIEENNKLRAALVSQQELLREIARDKEKENALRRWTL